MTGYEYCYYHEPTLKDVRTENSQRGGSTPRTLPDKVSVPRMETLEEVRQFAVETLHQVRTGHLEPRTAAVVSSLVAHVLKTLPDVEGSSESAAEKLRSLLADDIPEQRQDDEASESVHSDRSSDWETNAIQGV